MTRREGGREISDGCSCGAMGIAGAYAMCTRGGVGGGVGRGGEEEVRVGESEAGEAEGELEQSGSVR